MEMSNLAIWLSWVCVIVIGACVTGYYLHKRRKLLWLRGIKMPKLFELRPDDLTEKLKAATEREVAKAEKLRKVLEAKTELAKVRAENIPLQKDIDGVSAKSAGKEKWAAEQDRQAAQEAQKVKPRRL